MKTRHIYALTTAADGYRPRYVGKTIKRPERRLWEHVSAARRGTLKYRLYRWVRARVQAGHEIIMLCLERDAPSGCEAGWIAAMRAKGCVLLNAGAADNEWGEGKALSTAHRAAIGRAGKGKPGPWKGKSFDEEHRAAISRGLLKSGRDYTEQGKKTAAKLLGRKLSPEHAAAISHAHKGKKWSEAKRAAITAAFQRPEVKARMIESAKRRSSTPEQRASLSERGKLGGAKTRAKTLEPEP